MTEDADAQKRWAEVGESIRANVRKHLWDAKAQKFIPHIYLDQSPFPADFDENAVYYHGGTAMAIEAGLLSKEEIKVSNEAMLANVKALGAWYVMASMGLFDMKGLTDEHPSFALGSPLFDKITIRLNNNYYKGKEFVIKTVNNGAETPYVQQFRLNGKVLDAPRLPFSALSEGGTLELEMGAAPKDDYKNSDF